MNANIKILFRNAVTTKHTSAQHEINSGILQKTEPTITQSKTKITQPEKQFSQKELLQRYCGLEQLPKGKIKAGKKIGKGGCGTIVKGTLQDKHNNTIDIVIKKPNIQGLDETRKETIQQALESETNISSNLIQTAKQNFDIQDNLISSQEGLANISLQQKTTYNRHIQKYLNGQDGFEAIYNRKLDLYNTPTGHPKNTQQTLVLAQQFLNGIHALHEQGFAHCDIKAENIMIEMTKDGPKLTIIDLGGAAKFGEKSDIISMNAAPEVRTAWRAHNRIATSSEDIYAAGTVLCELLFGKNNKKWIYVFNEPQSPLNMPVARPRTITTPIQFIQGPIQQNIKNTPLSYYPKQQNPKQFLRNLLQEANQLENGATLYPPTIFNVISDLIVKMCAINPAERPSSQYCLAVLNDISLCTEAIDRYNELNAKENPSNDDKQLLAQLEQQVNKFKNERPMIVDTISQALQLIYDLNELNKKVKTELTPTEQATKEALVYNLKRDFEISPNNQQLKTQLQEVITTVTEGKTLKHDDLSELKKKVENHM